MALIWIITFVLFISNFGRFTDGNAQDHIVFPSAKLWDQKSDPFSSLSLPVDVLNEISRGSEAFSLELFQVFYYCCFNYLKSKRNSMFRPLFNWFFFYPAISKSCNTR